MEIKNLVIDGNNFNDNDSFYAEIDRVLTYKLNWQTGHNLDSFNDLLRGGFGVFEYYEPINLTWKNFIKSEEYFSDDFLKKVLEIILDHEHINFKIE